MTTALPPFLTHQAGAALQAALAHPLPTSTAVLLVEDDPINQMVVAAFLQTLGYTAVQVAANGVRALELCRQHEFGLVLMDCLMPEMDGLEATRALRARGYARPIIALTAHADEADVARCLDAGMDGHLAKPVDFHQMAALLRQWLGEPQAAAVPQSVY